MPSFTSIVAGRSSLVFKWFVNCWDHVLDIEEDAIDILKATHVQRWRLLWRKNVAIGLVYRMHLLRGHVGVLNCIFKVGVLLGQLKHLLRQEQALNVEFLELFLAFGVILALAWLSDRIGVNSFGLQIIELYQVFFVDVFSLREYWWLLQSSCWLIKINPNWWTHALAKFDVSRFYYLRLFTDVVSWICPCLLFVLELYFIVISFE